MNVLVACECSQRVCKAFRDKGHNAFSCDIQKSMGGYPEWHIHANVLKVLNPSKFVDPFMLNYGIRFHTEDHTSHFVDKWDLIIAHPPCTYFSNATMVNLGRKDYPNIFNDEWKRNFYKKRENAFDFVIKIWSADCNKICVENVVGYLSTHFQKPTQYIEPYYFGDPWKKKTCLWLKNLPPLEKTNEVFPMGKWVRHHLKTKKDLYGYVNRGVYSSKERSLTFKGIACAMADQWGCFKMIFKSAILLYLHEIQSSGISDNTVEDYFIKLRKFSLFLTTVSDDKPFELEDITFNLLFDYVPWLRSRLENSITVQSYVRALRTFLNWCYRSGYIDIDFCNRFKLPKARKSYLNILTDEEIIRIYECYPNGSNSIHLRNRVIISLMLDCGLRVDEVVTAERGKLHLRYKYLIITGKGNKQRAVSFGFETAKHIKAYLQSLPGGDSPHRHSLLLQVDGSSLTKDTIKNMFRKLKKKSGIERLYPHLLRHTFATRFLENGGNIFDLKELLGHTTLKQVQAYLHIANTRIIKGFERFSPLDNIKKASP